MLTTSSHSAWIYWIDGKVNMYDVINNLYYLIILLQIKDRKCARSIQQHFVSIGLQNVMDRYQMDKKAIQYNGILSN